MKTRRQIQSECLIAFIHSRLIGLGEPLDADIKPAFSDEKLSEKVVYSGKYFSSKLEKISTFKKVQAKLSANGNFSIQDIYYNSYKKLENLYLKHSPVGSEEIEGLVGLNLLALYLENWNEHNLKEHFDKLTHALVIYEQNVKDNAIFKRMNKVAENVFEDYMKYIGVNIC